MTLAQSWVGILNSAVTRHTNQSSLVPRKSPWEVAIEYVLLTLDSDKTAEKRIDELSSYFSFYGIEVADKKCFNDIVQMLFQEVTKNKSVIENLYEMDNKCSVERKNNLYNEIKTLHKNYTNDLTFPKKYKKTYMILNRPITPLLLANEQLVEMIENTSQQQLETKMEELSIEELLEPNLQLHRKPSKSMNIKRSYLEVSKVRVPSPNVFSETSMKAIFSYVDCESLKFPKPQFIVIKDFVVLIFEVSFI